MERAFIGLNSMLEAVRLIFEAVKLVLSDTSLPDYYEVGGLLLINFSIIARGFIITWLSLPSNFDLLADLSHLKDLCRILLSSVCSWNLLLGWLIGGGLTGRIGVLITQPSIATTTTFVY